MTRKFKPVTAADVTDEKLVAGQLRALKREVHAGFELLGNKLLVVLERMNNRQDATDDRLTVLERRVNALEAALKARP